MIVAIDGPAGSGKSTVAKALARTLGFSYLDTGAMYRSVAWLALQRGIMLDDSDAVARLADESLIEFDYEDGEELPSVVRIDGNDVTLAIRTPEVDSAVSIVAAIPAVRASLVKQQRRMAVSTDTVLEGRDIGSTVFPDAEVKVFLTASPEVRAKRRAEQNIERHGDADERQVYEAILRRDHLDESREHSPLQIADGAIEIDTSSLSVKQILERISGAVERARESSQQGTHATSANDTGNVDR